MHSPALSSSYLIVPALTFATTVSRNRFFVSSEALHAAMSGMFLQATACVQNALASSVGKSSIETLEPQAAAKTAIRQTKFDLRMGRHAITRSDPQRPTEAAKSSPAHRSVNS